MCFECFESVFFSLLFFFWQKVEVDLLVAKERRGKKNDVRRRRKNHPHPAVAPRGVGLDHLLFLLLGLMFLFALWRAGRRRRLRLRRRRGRRRRHCCHRDEEGRKKWSKEKRCFYASLRSFPLLSPLDEAAND